MYHSIEMKKLREPFSGDSRDEGSRTFESELDSLGGTVSIAVDGVEGIV